jgi:hypothetical protein
MLKMYAECFEHFMLKKCLVGNNLYINGDNILDIIQDMIDDSISSSSSSE